MNDGWTDIIRNLLVRDAVGRTKRTCLPKASMEKIETADFDEDGAGPAPGWNPVVKDPATAEALKPYYRQFCKRPCFHMTSTWRRSIDDNVTLVDTHGVRVSSVSPRRAWSIAGKEYEIDCLIYATGFESRDRLTRRRSRLRHRGARRAQTLSRTGGPTA